MSTPAIEISDLSYSYRSDWRFKMTQAVEPFSLTVNAGEAFGFLGHNGAGKTTTIKCILGLIKPKSGRIALFGKEARAPHARRVLGYIPEQPYFYENLTVLETLQFFARLYGVCGSAQHKVIAELVTLVGLEGRLHSSLRTLSKGLVQRVALAQALIGNPQLLVLDEPFSGLDPIGRKEFREIFAECKKKGTTIFISSHVLSDVELLCDRVSILVKGALKGVYEISELPRYTGATFELIVRQDKKISREALTFHGGTLVGDEAQVARFEFVKREDAESALRSALERRIEVESYQMLHGSLEELFVKLVNEGHRQ